MIKRKVSAPAELKIIYETGLMQKYESILQASLKEKKCSGKIKSRRLGNTVKRKEARIKCRELFRIFFVSNILRFIT